MTQEKTEGVLPTHYLRTLENIDYAFQPIVNPVTGITYAVEALMRGHENTGYATVDEFLDSAYRDRCLFDIEKVLRRKAIRKFLMIPFYRQIKLFLNYGHRIKSMPNYRTGITESILKEFSLSRSSVCLELSEKHRYENVETMMSYLKKSKSRGLHFALDDFGTGFSGLELFYHTEPDYIKIDRFFIKDINTDRKKRSFCSTLISLARVMGVIVIAEGVETLEEFHSCRNLGFDLVQGHFVRRPVTAIENLRYLETDIRSITVRDRRKKSESSELIERAMVVIQPVLENQPVLELFKRFNRDISITSIPIVDEGGFPRGLIRERSLKKYMYSPYGYELLQNRLVESSLKSYIARCPVVDINTSDDKIIFLFNQFPDAEGIIITKNLKYHGLLSSRSLLNIIYEKQLMHTKEVNPLTSLPGNNIITCYIDEMISSTEECRCFIHFDFDKFKPFNDRFGIRQGDRVIMMFSQLLQKTFKGKKYFTGHIGGDDFIACLSCGGGGQCILNDRISEVMLRFAEYTMPFYKKDEIRNGFYQAKSRTGEMARFPFMSLSAAAVIVPEGMRLSAQVSKERFYVKFADAKTAAKKSEDRICVYKCQKEDLE